MSLSVYDTEYAAYSTYHLAVNRIDRLNSWLGIRIWIGLRGLDPSVRLRKHVREIGRDRVVVLDHLLYCEEVLSRILFR